MTLTDETSNFRLSLWQHESMGLLAHRKPGKSQGESELSPWGVFLGFPRMLCIRVGRFQRPGRKHNGVKPGGFLQVTAACCLFIMSSNIRECGSREVTSLVGSGVKPQYILCKIT